MSFQAGKLPLASKKEQQFSAQTPGILPYSSTITASIEALILKNEIKNQPLNGSW